MQTSFQSLVGLRNRHTILLSVEQDASTIKYKIEFTYLTFIITSKIKGLPLVREKTLHVS